MPSGVYDHSHIVAWNKGLKGAYKASEETKAKLRDKRKGKRPGLGRKQSDAERQKHREAAIRAGCRPPNNTGRIYPPDVRKRMSEAQKKHGYMQHAKGENAPNWKGGLTDINRKIRDSTALRMWRELVKKRDNYTCRECGINQGKMHAHHIKKFSEYPEFRFDPKNGITLCRPCHFKVHGKILVESFTIQTPAT